MLSIKLADKFVWFFIPKPNKHMCYVNQIYICIFAPLLHTITLYISNDTYNNPRSNRIIIVI